MKQLVKSVQKIQELLEIAFVPAQSEPSDSEFESFSSAAMTSSSVSAGTNPFLYSSTASSTQSSHPSSTLSGVSSQGCTRKLWKKSELIEESICIRFQHGSCKYTADQCANSHLCARCLFSKHELLVPEHGSDWCQEDFS